MPCQNPSTAPSAKASQEPSQWPNNDDTRAVDLPKTTPVPPELSSARIHVTTAFALVLTLAMIIMF